MTIDIALKEWACVCDLLVEGRCGVLLRKGGVHELAGPGRFRLEHDRFALFPAWEHENLAWIKPELRPDRGPIQHEPAEIELRGYAEVAGLWEVPQVGGREAFDRLDDLHPWLPPQVDMRFDYKPDRPLYAMLVRAYALDEPKIIPNRRSFAGCRSWVPLEGSDRLGGGDANQVGAREEGAKAAVGDREFARWRERVEAALGRG